jgi:hypothetical protein
METQKKAPNYRGKVCLICSAIRISLALAIRANNFFMLAPYLTDFIRPLDIVTLAKNSRPRPVIWGLFAPVNVPLSRYSGPNILVSIYRKGFPMFSFSTFLDS